MFNREQLITLAQVELIALCMKTFPRWKESQYIVGFLGHLEALNYHNARASDGLNRAVELCDYIDNNHRPFLRTCAAVYLTTLIRLALEEEEQQPAAAAA